MVNPGHERVLLGFNFGNTNAGGLGDFTRVQALCAEARGNVRRRFAGEFQINQPGFRCLLSAKRLTKRQANTGRAEANWEKKTAPSKATRHAQSMAVSNKRGEPRSRMVKPDRS